ncbi:hypothetical protein KBX29_03955 [Corynebacterium sp. CCUG 18816]|uniref:hypothetical protein n=1 Tax=Corynebacterium pseudogenitalium TaxID=38303 RepID=UPI00210CD609|nr:hypothetical protein [Corynebacterium pseudogenitalium]MCQ4616001.1 hypothetical protein [Corynebacterium pseudogenitalium]
MTEDYRKAREWAEEILAFPETAYPSQSMVAKVLLDLLPKQTMADVEWDDDTHHLTGATSPGGDVVMMWRDVDDTEQIICVDSAWYPVQLTPNGKQYKLVEVTVSSRENVAPDQPDHPTALKIKQDFREAPKGTIVGREPHSTWQKNEIGLWSNEDGLFSSRDMSLTGPWEVLRWGWKL